MDEKLVANYLTALRKKTGLTYKALESMCDRSESTIKNLCEGRSEDPRIDTVAPIVYAMGGSMDEMLNPGKSKDEMKEVSVISLKDAYEFQIATMKETNEAHIANIRAHYERHIDELRESHRKCEEHYEKRLSDKREIIDANKKDCTHLRLFSYVCIAILVALLIAEVMNPSLGWFRY